MKSLGESRSEALRAYRTRWEGSIWGSRQQNRTGEKLIQPLFIQSLVATTSTARRYIPRGSGSRSALTSRRRSTSRWRPSTGGRSVPTRKWALGEECQVVRPARTEPAHCATFVVQTGPGLSLHPLHPGYLRGVELPHPLASEFLELLQAPLALPDEPGD